MKMTCERCVEEIAAFVSEAGDLRAEAAAHVRNCASCQAKMGQLQATAAWHRDSAANMAAPSRRLTPTQLEAALADREPCKGAFELGWRPMLAAGLALAVMLAAVMHRSPRQTVDATRELKLEQRGKKSAKEALEPTLLALHRAVESGRDQIPTSAPGAPLRHYQLKDVASELRN